MHDRLPTREQPERSAEQLRLEIQAEMMAIDYVLPGTINIVRKRCGKPGCDCRSEPPKLHGPYITWTRKIRGKTVTRRLTAAQLERYRPWIENKRRLRQLVAELEALSVCVVDQNESWS